MFNAAKININMESLFIFIKKKGDKISSCRLIDFNNLLFSKN